MDERKEPHLDTTDAQTPPSASMNPSETAGNTDTGGDTGNSADTSASTASGAANPANPVPPPRPAPHNQRRGLVSMTRDAWNGPRRTQLIIGGIIGVVIIVGLLDVLTSGHHKAPPPRDVAPSMPHNAGYAGGSAPTPYQQAAAAQNAAAAQQAEQHGQSYVPPMGELHRYQLPPAKKVVVTPKAVPVQHVRVMPTGYAPYSYQRAMDKEIRSITKSLVPVAALSNNNITKLPGQIVPTTASTAAASSAASAAKPQPVILAQPGHISFAVLDTSIKSTEPGPVMATIEDGRFAGAKLLGGFVRHAGRVAVEFNEMTLHHRSYPIQAVAITTDTARTALSTYTNYHVLYRYGWLIGASLLEGVTNALQMANTTSYLSGSGVGVVTQQLSNGQIAASAIGNVGEVLAPIMEKRFDTPPTVHVAAGTGVGILFMKPVKMGGKG